MNLESNTRKAENYMKLFSPEERQGLARILAKKPECEGCERPDCQKCCQHDDRDNGICLDCHHDNSGEENDYDHDRE